MIASSPGGRQFPAGPAPATNSVLLRDAQRKQWLYFEGPVLVLAARTLSEVASVLAEVEEAVSKQRLHAAGWISYEAAPAFDASLAVRNPTAFPLVWFGLFKTPVAVELPVLQESVVAPTIDWIPSISPARYQSCLSRIRDYIREGHTYQVNFTWRWRTSFGRNPWPEFLQMIRAQPHGYGGFIETDDWFVCSSSPELFFDRTGRRLVCRPMKGTAPRGLSCAEDEQLKAGLRQSEKNRAENLMVVDMVRNDMGRVVLPGRVEVSELFALEQYPTVWQMTSTVAGEISDGLTLMELFRALFPAASITGAPKSRTMQIIAELEDSPRGLYTGALGFVSPGQRAQFNVAIRTAVIDRRSGGAEFGVGGGIVWDSTASEEYRECLDKFRVLTHRRPEFRLLESMRWTPEEGFFLLDFHLKRLEDSARYFGISFDRPRIEADLASRNRILPGKPHKVRLLYSCRGEIEIEAEPLDTSKPSAPLRACLARSAVDIEDVFLYHKTTRRRTYETASQECPNHDEVLLWNPKGELTEFCAANLVLDLEGALVTPLQRCGLLAGTYRAWLLQRGKIRERVVRLEDLGRCRRVLAVNSVRGEREVVID